MDRTANPAPGGAPDSGRVVGRRINGPVGIAGSGVGKVAARARPEAP